MVSIFLIYYVIENVGSPSITKDQTRNKVKSQNSKSRLFHYSLINRICLQGTQFKPCPTQHSRDNCCIMSDIYKNGRGISVRNKYIITMRLQQLYNVWSYSMFKMMRILIVNHLMIIRMSKAYSQFLKLWHNKKYYSVLLNFAMHIKAMQDGKTNTNLYWTSYELQINDLFHNSFFVAIFSIHTKLSNLHSRISPVVATLYNTEFLGIALVHLTIIKTHTSKRRVIKSFTWISGPRFPKWRSILKFELINNDSRIWFDKFNYYLRKRPQNDDPWYFDAGPEYWYCLDHSRLLEDPLLIVVLTPSLSVRYSIAKIIKMIVHLLWSGESH